MTKSAVLIASLSALWLIGCDDTGIEGNGQRSDQLRETASFNRIRSDSELDVEVVQASESSVVVSIDSNLQHLVRTRVKDDTLYIDLEDEVEDIVDGPHVLVALPALSAAKLAGSGRMALWLEQSAEPIDFYLSGSGDMRFEGSAPAVGAFLTGSGSMRLLGATSDLTVELSGSGSVRARDLSAESATIQLSGSGEVSANVSQSVDVSISGSGDVDLYGDATLDGYESVGSGDLDRN